ncbi:PLASMODESMATA CALLOSE-BINDING PROTEIN 3-like [Rhododendron vialii]|uniref:PLASMODESMATA CALLOSE-BINDING PROTEIN 3-like n=1 Tax=Rhododendron vialii TaxID=182163 RepID=UPI00265E13EF|nr:PLASMODESMATA CALLOSE-BINDING PROTEIN 3-like [Rhododendron vialii]
MEVLVCVVLILANALHSSATWCICKDGVSDAALQKTLDYACGAGADCTPIHQNGACYNPITVRGHCNYAVNSYFQKKGQAQGSCDFSGTASATTSDPSSSGCVYPASASAANATPSTNTTSGSSPYSTGAFGPSSTDVSRGGSMLQQGSSLFCFLITLLFSALLRG